MSELNLIPYELKTKRKNTLKLKNYIAFVIIIIAIFFVIIYIPNLYLNKLTSEENSLTVKIASNSKVISENTKILAEIKSYDSYIKEVDVLKKQKVNFTDKIRNFQKYIPLDVVLTSINYSKGTITLGGASSNYQSISIFAANLQMSKEYPSARIANIIDDGSKDTATTKSEKCKFTITITE